MFHLIASTLHCCGFAFVSELAFSSGNNGPSIFGSLDQDSKSAHTVWFKKTHYTETCLIQLVYYDIKMESIRENYTGMVLLDLLKAFDTGDNTILLMNVKCSWQRDTSIERFKWYLTDR